MLIEIKKKETRNEMYEKCGHLNVQFCEHLFNNRISDFFETQNFIFKLNQRLFRKITYLDNIFSFFFFSDGPLCISIGINITEYAFHAKSSETNIWSITEKRWQHGRYSRLSGKWNSNNKMENVFRMLAFENVKWLLKWMNEWMNQSN